MESFGGNPEFPVNNLCPKSETGVLNFLAKNPTSDGRGIVIAVFDSGVDPGAPGLRITSTGAPKIIERYDCSGAGDVDTSKVVTPDGSGMIDGISGRKLKIPSSWINPTGNYHIGVKPVYELYTPKVKERMESKRKEINWDQKHRLLTAEANRRLIKEQNGNKPLETLSPLEKLNKEELEAQMEVLQTLEKKYKDHGPLMDCVVWQEGDVWKVCLSSDGDLETGIILSEYKSKQEFAPICKADQMNISVNVHNSGNTLEIVGMCGSHGTHVSSIAAGYFPENPDLNGVAPGAQIISFTIGDGRLGSMETGTSVARAMAFVMQNAHRIQVINMSYGEHAHWSTTGRLGELMKEVVDKYGLSWIVSAGNHGPALSTVGSPPWVQANNMIGIGAYVSSQMMSSEYSLRQKLPGMPYSWSSRGPTIDGDLGVSVAAPGGAITSVPNFTLRSAQLMNGTSMAAPHVAGCVALMLSMAVQKGYKWSPYSVKKALERSAQFLPNAEAFAQGYGLVQVEKASQTLEAFSTALDRDVRFNITVAGSKGGGSGCTMRGIYIRDPPLEKSKEFVVSVDPVFFKEDSVEPEDKINFRMNLCLLSTAGWVQAPKYFDLANLQRSFNVKVEVEGLSKGVHFAKIEAYDANFLQTPVFDVFVTVICPEIPITTPLYRPIVEFSNVLYEPGLIKRYFVTIPKGASWAALNLKMLGNTATALGDQSAASANVTARFVIHAMTLCAGQSCKSDELHKMVSLNGLEEATVPMKVTEGKVMEIVIARWWAEPNEVASINASITFRGLSLNRPEVIVPAIDAYTKLSISNSFGIEEVQPAAILKHQVMLLRPSDSKILSLSEPRDMIPQGRIIYQLENTYNFSILRSTEINVNCCLLSETLYESEYESQMWQLYDKNKRYVGCGDAYASKWNIKLEKGDYVLRLHVRHEKREGLEKLAFGNLGGNGGSAPSQWSVDTIVPGLPILLSMKLATTITLDVFQTQNELQDFKTTKKGTGWSASLKRESCLNVFLSTAITDKNLKSLPGSSTTYLQGTFTMHKDETGKKLISYPLKVVLPDSPPKPKSTSPKDTTKTKLEEMNEQLRDVQINWITKLEPDDSKNLYEKLVESFDSHLPLHVARLQSLDSGSTSVESSSQAVSSSSDTSIISSPPRQESDTANLNTGVKRQKTPENCREMIEISNKILGIIDQPTLLAFFGTRPTSQSDSGKTKQIMEKQRTAIVEALVKKGLAIAELLKMNEVVSTQPDRQQTVEGLDEILIEIQKYIDITDARVVEFAFQHAMARSHHSRALRFLFKHIDSEPAKWNAEMDRKILEVFKILDWTHCVWLWEGVTLLRYPQEYRPF